MDAFDAARATAWHKDLATALARRLEDAPAGPVLEPGCGAGGAVDLLSGHRRVVALDIVPGMVRRVRDRLHVDGVVADASRLPFVDGAFAAVTGAFWLQLMPDPAATLVEVARVLAPGGAVALAVQSPEWQEADGAVDADRLGLVGAERDHFVRCAYQDPTTTRLTDDELLDAASRAGLVNVRVDRYRAVSGVILLSSSAPGP